MEVWTLLSAFLLAISSREFWQWLDFGGTPKESTAALRPAIQKHHQFVSIPYRFASGQKVVWNRAKIFIPTSALLQTSSEGNCLHFQLLFGSIQWVQSWNHNIYFYFIAVVAKRLRGLKSCFVPLGYLGFKRTNMTRWNCKSNPCQTNLTGTFTPN